MATEKTINISARFNDKTAKGFKSLENNLSKLGDHINKGVEQFTKLSLAAGAVVTGGFLKFLNDSSRESKNFEKSMISLSVISETFGQDVELATKRAEELGQELRIGTGPAAETLQKLFKSGLNIDQASELMRRFTNEALTGKAEGIALSDAVMNLASGYQMEMSALMDRSGISENISTLMQREADLRGVSIEQLDEASRNQLKYDAFIRLTNETLGSAEKFTGSLIDKQAELQLQFQEVRKEVGDRVNAALAQFIDFLLQTGALDKFRDAVMGILDQIEKFAQAISDVATGDGPLGRFIQFLRDNSSVVKDFGIAAGAASVGITTLAVAMGILTSPLTLIIVAIGAVAAAFAALKYAYDNNLAGFGDLIDSVVERVRLGFELLKSIFQTVTESEVFQTFISTVRDSLGSIMENLGNAFSQIKSSLQEAMPAFQELGIALMPILQVLGAIAAFLVGAFVVGLLKVVEVLTTALGPAISVFIGALRVLASVITWLLNNIVIPVFTAIWQFISFAFNQARSSFELFVSRGRELFNSFKSFWSSMWEGMKGAWNSFKGTLSAIRDAISSAMDFIKGRVQTAKDGITGAFNTIKGAIDNVISAFQNLRDRISSGLPDIKLPSLPDLSGLPGFATGGQFTVGGSGGTDSQMVAFRATPGERVTIETPGQQRRGGMQTQSVTINVNGANQSPMQIAKEIERVLASRNQDAQLGLNSAFS